MAPTEACVASSLCTIITTTSPTPSNPSTELIGETLKSLGENAPELLGCRNIIVCDGYRSGASSKFRCGVVTPERAEAYEKYIQALECLAKFTDVPHWRHTEILRLEERQGFGFAVKAALELVQTPYVCIMQHDRTFMRPFHHVVSLIRAMSSDKRLKMIGLPTTTNDPSKYITQMETKLGAIHVPHPPLESLVLTSPECPALRFIPLIYWHDSTHFASTAYYREFVFGKRNLVSRGGFIEDKLGQQQGYDLRMLGWASHAEYGTWLLDDGAPPPTRLVGHLDGKKYLRKVDKIALEVQERAKAASASSPTAGKATFRADEYQNCVKYYQAFHRNVMGTAG
eukprot:gb/GFBE01064436.1/.p1 GENE.gb/GFBE01064436.1/~~gb/GFBE01064436.1/.p1  ORF type:complete len:341 (+),score=48.35 gb/GFBE01064436.1/:1-1023(+)